MRWIFFAIFCWLAFVLSLAGWWFYFGITNLPGSPDLISETMAIRQQRMLFMEGCVLMISLLTGGLALFYFAYRTYKEKTAKEMFFASFAHDLKTSLFRLQLEVEKLGKKRQDPELENVLSHTRKMTLDLENSLDSTFGYNKKVFVEKVDLKNFFMELHTQWPELRIKLSGENELYSDRKAFHSIFKNLLHNSFIHGQADEIQIHLRREGGKYLLSFKDNGRNFEGDPKQLGLLSKQHEVGAGFGLYIVRQWANRLGGKIDFVMSDQSALQVEIELPQRSKS